MTTPERYTNTCGSGLCMDRAPDGEWVNYDEYLTLRAERDALAQENEAMRRCAIKYLSWLDVVHKPLDEALREDMANPDMCGDAAIAAANGDAR